MVADIPGDPMIIEEEEGTPAGLVNVRFDMQALLRQMVDVQAERRQLDVAEWAAAYTIRRVDANLEELTLVRFPAAEDGEFDEATPRIECVVTFDQNGDVVDRRVVGEPVN